MLTVADLAGGNWPERARNAALLLSGCGDDESSARELLLTDLRGIFDVDGGNRLSSASIVTALGAMEHRPWAEWKGGKPITAPQLAKLLHPLGVLPGTVRRGAETYKGYTRGQLAGAWERYAPLQAVTLAQTRGDNGFGENPAVTNGGNVTAPEPGKDLFDKGCDVVTGKEGGKEAEGIRRCRACGRTFWGTDLTCDWCKRSTAGGASS